MSAIEPYGYAFQHEETGIEQVVDIQQVEWGFEKNNPRWQKIGLVYPEAALAAKDAEIERLREALQAIADDASVPQQMYDRNGPQWTSPQGNEYEDTSAHLATCNEIAEQALAALAGGSDA